MSAMVGSALPSSRDPNLPISSIDPLIALGAAAANPSSILCLLSALTAMNGIGRRYG
jgi:hypothetical protein